jgi:protein-S-isoprenylcysteine O-methyltransferase Ste14
MYIGGVAMLLGWALYLNSVAMALYSMGVFLLIHTFVVFAEEPGLRKRFGQEYENYCQAVPRWIPRFTRRHLPT